MGALILGSYYRQSTPVQRDAFFAAFSDYLTGAISQGLAFAAPDQTYSVQPSRPLGDASTVAVRVTFPSPLGVPVRLDLQWRKNSKTGSWQIYDLHTEGVSFVTTKQFEWAAVLRLQGVDGLTKLLVAENKITQSGQ